MGKANDIYSALQKAGIELPPPPQPVGSYVPYVVTGKWVYINQIGLKDGNLEQQGAIGKDLTLEDARKAVRQTLLNVLSVLEAACEGDLNKVERCVQLTGFFCTSADYTGHSMLLDVASDLLVSLMGEKGKHARAAVGVLTLPEKAPVELQAVFELK